MHVVLQHDLLRGGRHLGEVLGLLADVEHHRNEHDGDQDEEERPEELADDIAVEGAEHGDGAAGHWPLATGYCPERSGQ